jgi:hypothetical protein
MTTSSPLPPPVNSSVPGASSSRRNWLALVSALFGLGPPALLYEAANHGFFTMFGLLAWLTDMAALVTAHVALAWANRYRPPLAWRGLAIAGLVLGYLEITALLCFSFLSFGIFIG